MAYIYRISNLVNAKSYIGVSIDYISRWKQHRRALKNNRHCNKKLQNAWNKYGEECFEFQVIEECPYYKCFDEEIKYIALFNSYENGYNLTRGGDRGCFENTCKPVYVYDLNGLYVCEFMSKAEAERELDCHSIKECCLGSCKRGFSKTNQEWYQFTYTKVDKLNPYERISGQAQKVYQLDENGNIITIYNSLADANKSCHITRGAHNIRDASKTHKKFHNYYWSYAEDYSLDWKPYNENKIMCCDLDGNLIGYYRNATDAARQLNIDNSSISKVLRGERKQCNNYIFKRID